MNKYFLAFLLCPGSLLAQSSSPGTSASLLLTHVTVIDATGTPAKPDMTVHVRNHRIVAVRPSSAMAPPKDAVVVNASGKYLIPGLWDMYVHTGRRDTFLPLYIANGVTGVRDMGGDLEEPTGDLSSRYVQLRLWREAIERGSLVGPRFVIAGFLIDGYPWPGNVSVANAEEGRQAVDVLKQVGVDFIKVKSALSKEAYLAIADESRRQRIAEDLGTIETGKFADFVLLDANPLENISNTQRIWAVVANGRYLSRSDLDAMLAGVERIAN